MVKEGRVTEFSGFGVWGRWVCVFGGLRSRGGWFSGVGWLSLVVFGGGWLGSEAEAAWVTWGHMTPQIKKNLKNFR